MLSMSLLLSVLTVARAGLELASLHSKAVDYVKTGQPAEMPKRLRVARWPHFMEKKYKSKDKIYHSQNILGQLYDRVDSVDFVPQYEEPFDRRILKAFELEGAILKSARQVKSQYDTAVRRIMAQQEIATEFEVWTTFVLSKPRVGSDYKVQEDMNVISGALKARFQEVCLERAGGKEYDVLGPFVAAMYKVTKEELDIALAECRSTKVVAGREVPRRKMEPKYMPLISFPWLFEDVLCKIATGKDAFDDVKDLAVLSLAPKAEAGHRKRGVGKDDDPNDYIKMDDGAIVHRGEELDLFRPGPDPDGSSSCDDNIDEFYSDQSEHTIRPGKSGQLVLETSNPDPAADSMAGRYSYEPDETGVEDVVPRTQVDGLISSCKGDNALSTREALGADVFSLVLDKTTSHGIHNKQDVPAISVGNGNMSSGMQPSLDKQSATVDSQKDSEIVEEEVFLDDDGPESSLDRLARLMEM